MSPKTRAQLLFAALGSIVSLGLFIGMALSLEGGSSPTFGVYSMLFLIPFVILNPYYLLILPLGLSFGVPELAFGVLGLLTRRSRNQEFG